MLRLIGFLGVALGGRHITMNYYKQGGYTETAAMGVVADGCENIHSRVGLGLA